MTTKHFNSLKNPSHYQLSLHEIALLYSVINPITKPFKHAFHHRHYAAFKKQKKKQNFYPILFLSHQSIPPESLRRQNRLQSIIDSIDTTTHSPRVGVGVSYGQNGAINALTSHQSHYSSSLAQPNPTVSSRLFLTPSFS